MARPTRAELAQALRRVVAIYPTVGSIHTPAGVLDVDELRELIEREDEETDDEPLAVCTATRPGHGVAP